MRLIFANFKQNKEAVPLDETWVLHWIRLSIFCFLTAVNCWRYSMFILKTLMFGFAFLLIFTRDFSFVAYIIVNFSELSTTGRESTRANAEQEEDSQFMFSVLGFAKWFSSFRTLANVIMKLLQTWQTITTLKQLPFLFCIPWKFALKLIATQESLNTHSGLKLNLFNNTTHWLSCDKVCWMSWLRSLSTRTVFKNLVLKSLAKSFNLLFTEALVQLP